MTVFDRHQESVERESDRLDAFNTYWALMDRMADHAPHDCPSVPRDGQNRQARTAANETPASYPAGALSSPSAVGRLATGRPAAAGNDAAPAALTRPGA